MSASGLALALASGGARGAFQAGALLRLAELGLRFRALAGTSIGSLNGAYYAQGDGSSEHVQGLVRLWKRIPDLGIVKLRGDIARVAITTVLQGQLPTFAKIFMSELGGSWLLDPRPIAQLLDESIDYERLRTSAIDMRIVALPSVDPLIDIVRGKWATPEVFRASELSAPELRAALLAAGAIPFAFPSQEIRGRAYSDAALADELPAKHLYDLGFRRIASVFLADATVQHRFDYPGCSLWQVRPTRNINESFFSTFDFSRSTIERLLELGYEDAGAGFAEAADWMRLQSELRTQGPTNEDLARKIEKRRNSTRQR